MNIFDNNFCTFVINRYSAAHWLTPPTAEPVNKLNLKLPRYFTKHYITNNLRKVMFIAIYFLVNVALFTVSAVRYKCVLSCVLPKLCENESKESPVIF